MVVCGLEILEFIYLMNKNTIKINEFKILPVDGSVWFGDSGGGAFATIGGKKYQIGIIRSFSAIRIRGAPTIIENSCVRVDRYLVWIRSIIKP